MTRLTFALSLVLLVLTAGCGGGFPTEPEDFEFGRVDVYVRDTGSQPVNDVLVRLERRNGGVEDSGGRTGSVGLPGYYFFLKTTSTDYRVTITVPSGYMLAPNQSASVDVEFVKDQTRTVNFVLQKV